MRREEHLDVFQGFIFAGVCGVILWLIIAWACFGIYSYFNPCSQVLTDRSYVASAYHKERMSFHGVHNVVPAPTCVDDICWFERNGRKVKL